MLQKRAIPVWREVLEIGVSLDVSVSMRGRRRPVALLSLANSFTVALYMVIAWCLVGTFLPGFYLGQALYLLIGFQVVRLCFTEFTTSYRIATGISFLVLYAVYGPNLYEFDGVDPSLTISMFIIFVDVIFHFSARGPILRGEMRRSLAKSLYWVGFAISCAGVAFAFAIADSIVGLTVPLGCALFFQEGLLRGGQSKVSAWITCGIVEFSILVYMVLWWTGFGRLGIAAYLIMPFSLLSAYYPTRIKFWHLIAALPALLAIAAIVRGGSFGDLTSGVAVGVTDHMRLTEELRSGYFSGDLGVKPFVDQFKLFFLNWVPRGAWPGKPIGDGLYSVDRFWDRKGFGEDYSISLGFVGDQIFTLGRFYLIGLVVIVGTIIGIRRLMLKNYSFLHFGPLVVFDATLLTYFWGGMASFGARAWFSILPMIFLSLIISPFEKRVDARGSLRPSRLAKARPRALPHVKKLRQT